MRKLFKTIPVVGALAALMILSVVPAMAANHGGGPPEKVTVCHMIGTEDEAEITVPAHAAPATKHVEWGNSVLGPCPEPEEDEE